MRTLHKIVLAVTASIAIAAGVWAAMPSTTGGKSLASDLPPGPLLTLESPDFAALLHSWNASPEQTAWLGSANYSAFANTRLFSRLADAQTEFEGAAGGKHGFDREFLEQVAGKESIFAWYDISKLEFLYISHLAPGKSAKIELLQQRGKFSRRESGGTAFYVRTGSAEAADPTDASADTPAGPSTPRTVAFATRGDWLILATREDLIANALLLMASADSRTASAAGEGWYAAAEAAGPARHGDLHMLLDLQRITATPAFRTHWIQRNVTATRQYRAAVVDLFREHGAFREERTLLPNAVAEAPAQDDLAALEALVPERAGVYRATSAPDVETAFGALNEKLLSRAVSSSVHDTSAPAADLTVSEPGSASDLETRIDTLTPSPEPASAADAPLLTTLRSAGLASMLTVDRTGDAASLFVPVQSAVVLRSGTAWNSAQLQAAVLTAVRSRLTVSDLGVGFSPAPAGGYLTLGPAYRLVLFVDGNTAILANDATLLTGILARRSGAVPAQPANLIAAFRHTQERAAFHRMSNALSSAPTTGPSSSDAAPDSSAGENPDFFAASVGSLSDAFRALATERIVERREGGLTRQTVTYTWNSK